MDISPTRDFAQEELDEDRVRRLEELVPTDELTTALGVFYFKDADPREVIAYGLLRTACGYHTGGELRAVMQDLKLVGRPNTYQKVPALREKGREYLWAFFQPVPPEPERRIRPEYNW